MNQHTKRCRGWIIDAIKSNAAIHMTNGHNINITFITSSSTTNNNNNNNNSDKNDNDLSATHLTKSISCLRNQSNSITDGIISIHISSNLLILNVRGSYCYINSSVRWI